MKQVLLPLIALALLSACNQIDCWEGIEPTCPVEEGQSWATAKVSKAEDFCLGGYLFELEDESKLQYVVSFEGLNNDIDTDQLDRWAESEEWIEIVFHPDTALELALAVINIDCAFPMAVPQDADMRVRITCAAGPEPAGTK